MTKLIVVTLSKIIVHFLVCFVFFNFKKTSCCVTVKMGVQNGVVVLE